MLKIGVPRQDEPGETRVALTPSAAAKLTRAGIEVLIESGAGTSAHENDAAYEKASARIVSGSDGASVWEPADVLVTIHAPSEDQIARLRRGAVLIGMLAPLKNIRAICALAEQGVTSFSLEFIPRISRAQSMDALSSQANIAGYKAVVLAADAGSKIYPMMITAAGTIAPSRVFVIGAGVAGLQAIATARRLGAIVEAFDVRPAVKEEVQSLGARFVELPLDTADAQTDGGYAREQTEEQRRRQTELMTRHVIGADAVITTAAVFGKAPPLLIPAAVIERMRSGAVIVDMAADTVAGRGNCELTQPGRHITTPNGVIIIGETNLPALVPVHASQAYANNIHSLLKNLLDGDTLKLDPEDEIQKGAMITHDEQVVHPMVKARMEEEG